MAKIDLRAYHAEIESLINRGRYDEAIANCRHILQVFPKSVQTYRLLGKAFLEAKRYTDAVDIFQRVLSALPSDFVSHLGLSIIREDEGNLDTAIWHMERAFEIQPYNSAIQDELRRLFERRDGSAPPKIRLNKSALARMYAKGNLYQQSAAEARSILTTDPQRLDIQVLLADMYLKSGKSVEAAEISSKIINRLPYCLQANRILVSVLENSEHREEYQQYKDRLISLDPYEARVTGDISNVEQVPNEVVQIDKLDLAGDQLAPTEAPADWMTSLGLTTSDFDTELEDELPEWLVAASEQIQQETTDEGLDADLLEDSSEDIDSIEWLGQAEEASTATIEEIPPIPEEVEELPDWMREAGWQEPAEGEDEEAIPPEGISFDYEESEADAAPAAEADIPDWLRELAPDEIDVQPQDLAASEQDAENDSDLAALFDQHEEEGLDFPAASAAAAGVLGAGMLKDLIDEDEQGEESISQAEIAAAEDLIPEVPEEETELPDWLQEFDTESEQEAAVQETSEAVDIPAWLAELDTEASDNIATEEQASDQAPELPVDEDQTETEQEIPDWLAEFEEQSPQDEELEQAEQSAEELPAWLQEIEDTVIKPEIEVEEEDFSVVDEISPAQEPDTQSGEIELEEPPDFEDADDALAWLAGLAASQALEIEETPETPEEKLDIDQESTPEEPEALPDLPKDDQPTPEGIELAPPPDFEDMDEAVGWLEQLAEGAPGIEEQQPSQQVSDYPETDIHTETPDQPETAQDQDIDGQETFGGISPEDPVEKLDLNKASLVEIERLPGVGFRTAQLIVAYRDSHGPFLRLEDVASIPGLDPDDFFTLQQYFTVDVEPDDAGPETSRSVKHQDLERLKKARQAASEGDIESAIQNYTQLVNEGSQLDDVIFDLNQQLQSRPDNIELWQLVGDAYMRNNQLIEAMQAYNKAEDLLR